MQCARYADDAVMHAASLAQAQQGRGAGRDRLLQGGLELHPAKTRIVYCQDADRTGTHAHIPVDFLGDTLAPRRAKNRWGKSFVSFLPAVSKKAAHSIRATMRSWRLGATRNNQSLEAIAQVVNPSVRGWGQYYGRFYRSALIPVWRCLERALVYWARRKYKRLRRHRRRAEPWLGRIARRVPQLFVLWHIGMRPAAGQ
jgi:RNA-directed DNA polymerase